MTYGYLLEGGGREEEGARSMEDRSASAAKHLRVWRAIFGLATCYAAHLESLFRQRGGGRVSLISDAWALASLGHCCVAFLIGRDSANRIRI